jgi:hypothetical protein
MMGLFGRGMAEATTPSGDPAIGGFWAWWRQTGVADQGDLVSRVGLVHPDILSGLASGVGRGSRLVLTAGRDADLRERVQQLLAAAPEADGAWEYAGTGAPLPSLAEAVLFVGQVRVAVGDARFAAARKGYAYRVVVHHPAMIGLSLRDQRRIAWLLVDAVLGEPAAQCWLRSVQPATESVADGVGLAELPRLTAALRAECVDDDGEPRWVRLGGEGRSGRFAAEAQIPLVADFAPRLSTHVLVSVPYVDRAEDGLPGTRARSALARYAGGLVARLGREGRLVAHESNQGTRRLHFYVDPRSNAVTALRSGGEGWSQGRVKVKDHSDPDWSAVAHLRA